MLETNDRVANRLSARLKSCRPATLTVNGNLFHYTTAAGLIGIVRSSQLWATGCEYLNDPQEMSYGIDLAVEVLIDLCRHDCDPISNLPAMVQNALGERNVPSSLYVASFCGDGDLLDQWRGYSDAGRGYCIEFDRLAIQLWADNHEASLVPVEYDISIQKQLLRDHLNRALIELRDDLRTSSDPESSWERAAQNRLCIIILALITRYKHGAFRAEGERRLIYTLGSIGIENDCKRVEHRQGGGFVIPYLPLPLTSASGKAADGEAAASESLLPIVSVRCGPTTHAFLGKAGIKSLLQRYSYDLEMVKIHSSAVPYRS